VIVRLGQCQHASGRRDQHDGALGLSLKTVQNYVARVLDKLQVTDRAQAAIRAHDGRAFRVGIVPRANK